MGLLDFLFGRNTQQSDLKTNTKSDDDRVKEQNAQKSDNTIEPFVFKSNCHQRYENGLPKMGLQECFRTVCVEKNIDGCKGYKLEPGIGYIVKVFNDDLGKPNMSDKPMKVVRKTENSVELRGFPIEAVSPFGWQESQSSHSETRNIPQDYQGRVANHSPLHGCPSQLPFERYLSQLSFAISLLLVET